MITQSPRIGAVILAGGGVPPTLVEQCHHRALLRLNGRYLLEYQLETLAGVPSIVETALLIPQETLADLDGLSGLKIPAGDTMVENMRRGTEALAAHAPTHLLFITGDVPLITPAGLQEYIQSSLNSDAVLTYPIIPRSASERRFPGAKRTYVKLKEGTFTGGNAVLTLANQLDGIYGLIHSLYSARKDPLKLAGILGWSTVLRMLTGTLTLPYLEGVAARILGAPVRAIVTDHAEIGFDVDKADDLAAVERALARGTAG